MRVASRFQVNVDQRSIQVLVPPDESTGFEGVAFSSSGNILAVAAARSNAVLFFRRKTDGRFEDAPYWRMDAPTSGLRYPHDVAFSKCADTELLAIAQRHGAITIHAKKCDDDRFGPDPIVEISGPDAKLAHSDGVAFVPPRGKYLAACNLLLGTISFYRRTSLSPIQYDGTPEFELTHPSLCRPDGLAFSSCGRWLASANHGNHSASLFQRRNKLFCRGKLRYGPAPAAIIAGSPLCYPHSVAFSPRTNHLIVTNAGANSFCAYEPTRRGLGTAWSRAPALQVVFHEDQAFRSVNTGNPMEGGPKGVAMHENCLAVCSPEIGVKVYSCREAA